jgi:hypothetical protein
MKPSYQMEKIETNINDNEMQTYQIEANEVLFGMLSSDIYEDKIGTLIRELSTNACDAMIEAGKLDTDNPENGLYDVHLPTHLEPYFSIRDYGTGLDEEGIKYVFTYGKSTRRNSNYFSGLLGIGAKCPHAYSDKGFSVTSYFNGVYHIYYCSKNEMGLPSLLETGNTNEPNGVEIKIAVKQDNIEQFKVKAENIYYWFRFRPNLNIDLNFEKEVLIDEDIYSIIKTKEYPYYKSGILMGDILYNINYDLNHFAFDQIRILKKIIIKANIGDVDIQPSREFCKLSPKTISYIKDKVKNVKDNFLKKKSDELISYYESGMKLKDLYTKYLKIDHSIHDIFGNTYDAIISKIPRLKSYHGRIFKLRKHEMIYNVSSYCYGSKLSYMKNDLETIIVKDKDIKISHFCKKYGKFLLIDLYLPYFGDRGCKVKNRYDYEKVKEKAKKSLAILLRCNSNDLIFTSEMQVAKEKSNQKYDNDKTFILSYMESRDLMKLSKDTEFSKTTLYARIKGMRDQHIFYDSAGNSYYIYDRINIIKILKKIKESKGDTTPIDFLKIFKSEVADKYLKKEKLVNVIDYIKENLNHIKITQIDDSDSTIKKYLKAYDSLRWYSDIKETFKPKLYDIIMNNKDKIEEILKLSNDCGFISILKSLNIFDKVECENYKLPQDILDYDEKYGKTIVSHELIKSRYSFDYEILYLKEFWVDNYIDESKEEEPTEDAEENEISNS